jgi:hypothetical protein
MQEKIQIGRARIDVRAVNPNAFPIRVLVATPSDGPFQRVIDTKSSHDLRPIVVGQTPIAEVSVAPHSEFQLTSSYLLTDRRQDECLTDDIRAYYLRETLLVDRSSIIEREAARLRNPSISPYEQVLLIACHVAKRMRYKWPVPDRGATTSLLRGSGDCGEYSFIVAAIARALGIPARVVSGTLLGGRSQAHAWVEAFVDGVGWTRFDPSLNARSNLLWTPNVRNGDDLVSDRIAFCCDDDIDVFASFDRPSCSEGFFPIKIQGTIYDWGGASLDRAPYLQPLFALADAPNLEYPDIRWVATRRLFKPWARSAFWRNFFMGVSLMVLPLSIVASFLPSTRAVGPLVGLVGASGLIATLVWRIFRGIAAAWEIATVSAVVLLFAVIVIRHGQQLWVHL